MLDLYFSIHTCGVSADASQPTRAGLITLSIAPGIFTTFKKHLGYIHYCRLLGFLRLVTLAAPLLSPKLAVTKQVILSMLIIPALSAHIIGLYYSA